MYLEQRHRWLTYDPRRPNRRPIWQWGQLSASRDWKETNFNFGHQSFQRMQKYAGWSMRGWLTFKSPSQKRKGAVKARWLNDRPWNDIYSSWMHPRDEIIFLLILNNLLKFELESIIWNHISVDAVPFYGCGNAYSFTISSLSESTTSYKVPSE